MTTLIAASASYTISSESCIQHLAPSHRQLDHTHPHVHALMMKTRDMKRGSNERMCITKLPVELVRQTLAAVADLQALRSAVVSCPFFYRAFVGAENSIVEQVLRNHISEELLPELLVAHRSSSLLPSSVDSSQGRRILHDLVQQILLGRRTSDVKISFLEALRLGDLYTNVDFFARKFAAETLGTGPLSHDPFPATHAELTRIRRALCCFELFRNYFSKLWTNRSRMYEVFLDRIAPWEIEQLACIHDFLVRAVMPAFNDVAEHDVVWGMSHIEYGENVQNPSIQQLLLFGLGKLREIVEAETYDERYRILNAYHSSLVPQYSIYEALQAANGQDDTTVAEFATGIVQGGFSPPMLEEHDAGPQEIWQWAHWEEEQWSWIYQPERDNLRRWGYVLWDKARLDATGIFRKPWENPDSPEDELEKEHEAIRQQGWMQNSWERRERICLAGGLGWWSWGDESKIRWRTESSKTNGRRRHPQT